MASPMQILSVNISPLRTVEHHGKTIVTGIYKKPVGGRVRVGPLGLEGDAQGDTRHHGGEHMALYAYTADNYAYWSEQLARPLEPGLFGENLIISGMDEFDVAIGDRFRLGPDVEVEVSIPRAPCATFAMVMDDATFPKRFFAAGRMGFYLRVLREGTVGAGDAVVCTHRDPVRLTIAEVTRTVHFDKENRAALERALRPAALAPLWRERARAALDALSPS